MPHPRGKRSREAQIHRAAVRYVLKNAYRCRIWAETINRVDRAKIRDFVVSFIGEEIFEGKPAYYGVPDLEKGWVLIDSRGRGALQK